MTIQVTFDKEAYQFTAHLFEDGKSAEGQEGKVVARISAAFLSRVSGFESVTPENIHADNKNPKRAKSLADINGAVRDLSILFNREEKLYPVSFANRVSNSLTVCAHKNAPSVHSVAPVQKLEIAA